MPPADAGVSAVAMGEAADDDTLAFAATVAPEAVFVASAAACVQPGFLKAAWISEAGISSHACFTQVAIC